MTVLAATCRLRVNPGLTKLLCNNIDKPPRKCGGCVTIWGVIKCVLGVSSILVGLFRTEFKPLGWTTAFIWGGDEGARIPRWVAGPFYVLVGALMLYWGISGK